MEEIYVEFEITKTGNKVCYNLPAGINIFLASKTLITLSLKGCELENWNSSISLLNLQILVLQQMDVDETFVQNLLDNLTFFNCNKLISLDIPTIQRTRALKWNSALNLEILRFQHHVLSLSDFLEGELHHARWQPVII